MELEKEHHGSLKSMPEDLNKQWIPHKKNVAKAGKGEKITKD